MTGQGQGPGAKDFASGESGSGGVGSLEQIEYLLFQSCQGVHFIFDNSQIASVLRTPTDEVEFSSSETMERVQGLLAAILDCPTIVEKKNYLGKLPREDFEILVRAYFQLVENTVLAHSDLRH